MSKRKEILESIKRVPQLPASSAQLIALLQNTESDPDELTRVISLDPDLTAHILRAANSAGMGGNGAVTTVAQALMRLGTARILGAVLSASLGPIAMKPVAGYGLGSGSLWENCVAVALATDEFAHILGQIAPPEAFTAGLLCDIGKLVLGQFVAENSAVIHQRAFEDGLPYNQAERSVMGIDHAEVGATLLQAWSLPDCIVEAVRWHHDPGECDEIYRDVVDLVHLASCACIMSGIGGGDDGTDYVLSGDVASRLGASINDIELGMCNTLCKLEEARDLFGLHVVGASL